MVQFDFHLDTGDKNVGTVYLPQSMDERIPVVIYCHGWGGNRGLTAATQSVCSALLESSSGMVAFDFYGCGDTGGSYSQMSYGRWTTNLKDIFEWVARQTWADARKIGFFARSSGTTAALRFAEESSDPAFVVSVGTCLGLFINMPDGPGRVLAGHWDALSSGGTAEVFGVPMELEFYRDFIGKAPVYELKKIRCPVFFLQGAEDNIWRRTDARLGYEILKEQGRTVKHYELAGGDHNLDQLPDQCAQGVIQWLKEIQILT
jgi:pimeloyl-ACP methyl ester carboxylesterase